MEEEYVLCFIGRERSMSGLFGIYFRRSSWGAISGGSVADDGDYGSGVFVPGFGSRGCVVCKRWVIDCHSWGLM